MLAMVQKLGMSAILKVEWDPVSMEIGYGHFNLRWSQLADKLKR